MRKNGIGLTSVPIGNTPGDENVEVSHVTDDDIEASNRTGFNQISLQDFLDDKEFSEIINIEKESFKMRKELIKLNNQLNRLGYKNLIKISNDNYDELKKNLEKLYDGFRISFENSFASDAWANIKEYFLNVNKTNDELTKFITSNEMYREKINTSIFILRRGELISKYFDEDRFGESYTSLDEDRFGESYTSLDESSSSKGSTGVSNTGAAMSPGGTSITEPRKITHRTGTQLRDLTYTYEINDPLSVTITIISDGRVFNWTPQSVGISKWNIFANTLNKMSTDAPSPAPPPVAADATSATPTTSGIARETINGKPAVSVGTFRGNVLYVTMESIKAGKPIIYVKSPEGRVQVLGGADDNRARDYLGNREIKRILRALEGYGLNPQGRDSFKDYMRSDRRNRWNRVRGKKYEDETDKRMDKASQRMQGSNAADDGIQSTARQKRLDHLKKKGII